MKNLSIDPERLWDDLMLTAKIGATPKGGICRLTLTELDREVRDWFKVQTESLGCAVMVDGPLAQALFHIDGSSVRKQKKGTPMNAAPALNTSG